jgi:hypothetical protein
MIISRLDSKSKMIDCAFEIMASATKFIISGGSSSVGRAKASQALGRGFEPRFPLFLLIFSSYLQFCPGRGTVPYTPEHQLRALTNH